MRHLLRFGPILFAAVLAGLSVAQYDFMRGLGWHPLYAPTFDWPSGLALGKFGYIMTAAFVVSGFLISALALRLKADLKPAPASRVGSTLFILSGLALAGLAFTTDPTLRVTPASWHGVVHDLSFVLLGVTLFPAMFALGLAFRQDEKWRDLSHFTWLTLGLAVPAFILKGAAFYVFLFSILLWCEGVALRVK